MRFDLNIALWAIQVVVVVVVVEAEAVVVVDDFVAIQKLAIKIGQNRVKNS